MAAQPNTNVFLIKESYNNPATVGYWLNGYFRFKGYGDTAARVFISTGREATLAELTELHIQPEPELQRLCGQWGFHLIQPHALAALYASDYPRDTEEMNALCRVFRSAREALETVFAAQEVIPGSCVQWQPHKSMRVDPLHAHRRANTPMGHAHATWYENTKNWRVRLGDKERSAATLHEAMLQVEKAVAKHILAAHLATVAVEKVAA